MVQSDLLSLFDEEINRGEVPALKTHPMVVGLNSENLFAAGVADMDFKAPPPVLEAMQKRLGHGVFGYEAVPTGLLPALIRWLQEQHDWEVPKDDILTSPNILTALAMAASLFTEEGDAVIVQPPVFFDFFDVLEENHREIVQNPLIFEQGRYRMDFEDLEEKASDPKTKMIYLCNPHNPVARVWNQQELRTLGDVCNQHGVLVVSDEMHADLVFTGNRYTPFAVLGPEYAANCITCISPAKTFNIASCCASFTLIADEDMRKAFQVENSRLSVNKNNPFANVAMKAAYSSGAPWLKAVIAYLERNVELVRDSLDKIPGVELIEPEGTFLLWVNFNGLELELDELYSFLRKKAKWSVTRGHSFGKEGNGFARVNVACTRAKLETALANLELAVGELHS
ncbi:MAG: pyridoxal phosphate-dependent aminotransferase [Gammaproteobacteria bacterium]|nr:pyridoxal phosphate-dependent aminotransferase [Gammaproteobacteria bacterium]